MLQTGASSQAIELPPISDFDDPDYDPFAGDVLAFGDALNPYARIAEMAAQNWVHKREYRMLFVDTPNAAYAKYNFDAYMVLGYDKCTEIFTHTEASNWPFSVTLGTSFGRTISAMDPPEHTMYRRIFQKAFLPHTVRQWGDSLVAPVVGDLLDQIEGKGRADLVEDFTLHYPFQVIYRQLNLPRQDVKIFHKLALAQISYFYSPETAIEAGRKLGVYLSAMVQARRANPGDDLVSSLSAAEVDGERLPEEVVVSFLRQLMNAGGDTTYRGTSSLLTALLTHPEQMEAVRKDRSLVPAAIEEALRWEAPIVSTDRMAKHDITLDGFTFPKGAVIDLVIGSANRDPAKFTAPDTFDIFRDRTYRTMAFATGPHVCVGQHLARIEMERALNAVLDRLPNLRLDPDMPAPEIRGYNLRVPKHIHVRFD